MSKPVQIKCLTFDEMLAETEKKAKASEERYKTGLCDANKDDGTRCSNNHTGEDGFCDSCRDTLNRLWPELGSQGGFFGVSVRNSISKKIRKNK